MIMAPIHVHVLKHPKYDPHSSGVHPVQNFSLLSFILSPAATKFHHSSLVKKY